LGFFIKAAFATMRTTGDKKRNANTVSVGDVMFSN
jgi:hypothetical protein